MGSLAVAGRNSRLIRISHEDYQLVTNLAVAEKRTRVAQLSAMIHEAARARTRRVVSGEAEQVNRKDLLPTREHDVR